MPELDAAEVFVRVESTDPSGRQIAGVANLAESLGSRAVDIARGIAAGTEVISGSIANIANPDGWSLESVDATFGITLGTEGSVIVSKASFEASFEVTVSYRRNAEIRG